MPPSWQPAACALLEAVWIFENDRLTPLITRAPAWVDVHHRKMPRRPVMTGRNTVPTTSRVFERFSEVIQVCCVRRR